MTVEQRRMEEAAKRAAQRAVNQLRMSRRTHRSGTGQVKPNIICGQVADLSSAFRRVCFIR